MDVRPPVNANILYYIPACLFTLARFEFRRVLYTIEICVLFLIFFQFNLVDLVHVCVYFGNKLVAATCLGVHSDYIILYVV